jgi:hypothetical protein
MIAAAEKNLPIVVRVGKTVPWEIFLLLYCIKGEIKDSHEKWY